MAENIRLDSARELKGLAILSTGNSVVMVKKGLYRVKSQTGVGEYDVCTHRESAWTCTCPDYAKNHADCKHIFAVRFSLRLKESISADQEKAIPQEVAVLPQNCPSCGGRDIIRRGIRRTRFGQVQRFACKSCKHRFTVDKGFSRMKHDPKAITLSMDLFFKGVSYRKICDHLSQFYDIEVDHTTPIRWVKKYLALMAQYSDEHKAEVSNIWHSDEMTCFIKKKGEKGYFEWIWNVMDSESRYLLACKITQTKYVVDARKPLREAKQRTDVRPEAIVTDGLQAYRTAIPNEFYQRDAFIRNPHVRLKNFEVRPNNNILERLNGTCRERLKVMRGLPDSSNAQSFMDGLRVYYNYIRPHQGLDGMTPAQMAGSQIVLTGNRWAKMIELARSSALATSEIASPSSL